MYSVLRLDYVAEFIGGTAMLTIIRYLAILAIAGFAVSTDSANAIHYGSMQKEVVAAALIALLSLPTIIRWSN